MELVYLEDYEKYFVIRKDEYEENIYFIVSCDDYAEEALMKAIGKLEQVYDFTVQLLEKIGAIASDRETFSLNRDCELTEVLEEVPYDEDLFINGELIETFSYLKKENNEFKPIFI